MIRVDMSVSVRVAHELRKHGTLLKTQLEVRAQAGRHNVLAMNETAIPANHCKLGTMIFDDYYGKYVYQSE